MFIVSLLTGYYDVSDMSNCINWWLISERQFCSSWSISKSSRCSSMFSINVLEHALLWVLILKNYTKSCGISKIWRFLRMNVLHLFNFVRNWRQTFFFLYWLLFLYMEVFLCLHDSCQIKIMQCKYLVSICLRKGYVLNTHLGY